MGNQIESLCGTCLVQDRGEKSEFIAEPVSKPESYQEPIQASVIEEEIIPPLDLGDDLRNKVFKDSYDSHIVFVEPSPYIEYPPSYPILMEDDSPYPFQLPLTDCSYDAAKRTFCGTITYDRPDSQGDTVVTYKIVLNKDFTKNTAASIETRYAKDSDEP